MISLQVFPIICRFSKEYWRIRVSVHYKQNMTKSLSELQRKTKLTNTADLSINLTSITKYNNPFHFAPDTALYTLQLLFSIMYSISKSCISGGKDEIIHVSKL